mmetsp:Transcript_16643/g.39056  ORF Transcript_16643/g.39056 Transcript_16643/m.39056 type:complete len:311 (+) Transcript_16643:75-1007(+)|eukprot:CAMPEP_0171093280 /NCGR_PEP_ID=MMETSP0766_2-20121228/38985_1 /TAXON_ID=439317 /ORGANISM="Gambierdiscus australes, Strain CAWD 149" /LENGTH=310 /DNA_ID=CAMNT_0011551701 /DNA_START=66 /DNA_END=998 /DNA_ORIENTATION=+
MSCSPDAFTHFEQREQALLALNQQLEHKKAHALAEASNAVRDAESSLLQSRVHAASADGGARMQPAAELEVVVEQPVTAGTSSRAGSSSSRPPSAHRATAESSDSLRATLRLQNARIAALQEELDKTISELASRDSEARQLKQEVKQLSDENRRLLKEKGPAESLQEKLKKQVSNAEAKVKDLEGERAELLRIKDQFDVASKRSEADSSTKEARINRLTEECEKYKQQLKEVNSHDKDRSALDRKEKERLVTEVRKLERQRSELVSAFKKQMKLIDVLKRQRAHMEAARVLSFTEDEFIRILELSDKLGE